MLFSSSATAGPPQHDPTFRRCQYVFQDEGEFDDDLLEAKSAVHIID